ncbi:NUDIX hydrolase [Streptomyces sp. NPDC058947]|uniref:NUDIX hydrolase n=1 Tax=Streptomyces sp. NPDC058947 TaxID=3346675 RepID=UPI0036885A8C
MTTQLDLKPLAPLARTIAETIRDTPVRLGSPEGAADLAATLTVKVAAYVGSELPDTPGLAQHMVEVDAERQRQLAKFGDQHHPDGTGDRRWRDAANYVRGEVDDDARFGRTTWNGVLREEVFEALAESDPAKLRAELIQVAAVCAAWIHDIDSRQPASAQPAAR